MTSRRKDAVREAEADAIAALAEAEGKRHTRRELRRQMMQAAAKDAIDERKAQTLTAELELRSNRTAAEQKKMARIVAMNLARKVAQQDFLIAEQERAEKQNIIQLQEERKRALAQEQERIRSQVESWLPGANLFLSTLFAELRRNEKRTIGESDQNRLHQMEGEYRKISDEYPDLLQARLGLGTALLCRSQSALRSKDTYHNAEQAIELFRSIVEASGDPSQADAYVGLGDGFVMIGELDSAGVAYARALELDPFHDQAHQRVMESADFASGSAQIHEPETRTTSVKPTEQEQSKSREKEQGPKNVSRMTDVRKLILLGESALEHGTLAEAIGAFRWAVSLEPEQGRAQLGLGRALHVKGDFAGAAAALRKAVQMCVDVSADARIDPNNPGRGGGGGGGGGAGAGGRCGWGVEAAAGEWWSGGGGFLNVGDMWAALAAAEREAAAERRRAEGDRAWRGRRRVLVATSRALCEQANRRVREKSGSKPRGRGTRRVINENEDPNEQRDKSEKFTDQGAAGDDAALAFI